jgi:hypothetical protein
MDEEDVGMVGNAVERVGEVVGPVDQERLGVARTEIAQDAASEHFWDRADVGDAEPIEVWVIALAGGLDPGVDLFRSLSIGDGEEEKALAWKSHGMVGAELIRQLKGGQAAWCGMGRGMGRIRVKSG